MKNLFQNLACLLLLAAPAFAVDSVAPTPSTIVIPETGNAQITIRWRVSLSSSVLPGDTSVTINGAVGTLLVDATPVPLPNSAVSRTVIYSPPGLQTFTVIDRIRIDRTTAQLIANGSTATFSRVFSDTETIGTATGLVALDTGPNSALGFRQFDLTFDDASRYRSVAQSEALQARLSISSSGRGTMRGVWEVAGPDNQTLFRGVGRATQPLVGNQRVVLESPELPTDRPGIYRVRFVPDGRLSPTAEDIAAPISYVVARPADVTSVGLISPQPDGFLSTNQRFAWNAVDGAVGYRLEFLNPNAAGAATRLAAIDIVTTSTTISPVTMARLVAETGVTWRVTAFDAEGTPIARSAQRGLRVD